MKNDQRSEENGFPNDSHDAEQVCIPFLTRRNVFVGVCVATAALWSYNKYIDHKIQTYEEQEEENEREKINKLKEKLPQRVLSRYGLHK